MKTIKVSEATSLQIDWLVAKYEERHITLFTEQVMVGDIDKSGIHWFNPSTNWAQGGPIIDEALVSTGPIFMDGQFHCWEAFGHDLKYDDNGEYIEGADHRMYGPTRLIAGLRCLVSSKLGDEVEVPEELL